MTTESFRKDVARKLNALQEDEDEGANISFPKDLTSSDRKYVHKIAESFRLHTMSSGVGTERQITVYKNPPEGQESKLGQRAGAGFTPDLALAPEMTQQLRRVAATAPPGTGRVLLANVRPLSRVLATAKQPQASTLTVGEACEGYWPDDDTWLSATLAEQYEDGSFRIVWTDDQSESDVPADYVRVVSGGGGSTFSGGVAMSVDTMEAALEKRRA
eukprot:CAMPEP_0204544278 /NCGR_PEP_ID=MMETSP0661-20131031/20427_1 /ASSEMBLY_ACC=CAM_ASM_000606 /TAXON_ID=109239 /ORGANISM="Alexandrium margalefi, Strain AMGDE01CS-322" /LENGTH=215 /DNA_ID=CAMNT_0051551047 /DNA_START=11 /DNA_END=655 /DNA_ORIENTATION=-